MVKGDWWTLEEAINPETWHDIAGDLNPQPRTVATSNLTQQVCLVFL